MWDSTFNATGGGGFENGNNTGSPSSSKQKGQVKRTQSVVPVVVRQILECPDEEFHLFDMPVQIVSLVGILYKFDLQSTKAVCEIGDFSGSIKAVLWLESESGSAPDIPAVKEGSYVQAFGSVRNQDGEKMIMLLHMVPVDDCNVITNHLLQFIYVRLEAEALSCGNVSMDTKPSTSTKSMSDMQDEDLMNFTGPNATLQRQVFAILKPVKDCVGVSKDTLYMKFPGQVEAVNEVLEFFLGEGYAYTTIDNDHFKLTEGFV